MHQVVGQGQVGHFDLAGAQRLEVLRGPFSVLYGNSSGGVISMVSAPVRRTEAEGGIGLLREVPVQPRAGLAPVLARRHPRRVDRAIGLHRISRTLVEEDVTFAAPKSLPYGGLWGMLHEARTDVSMVLGLLFLLIVERIVNGFGPVEAVSQVLGEPMKGIDVRQLDEKELLQTRGW